MDIVKAKEEIKNNIKWSYENPNTNKTGGQSTGIVRCQPITLYSEELDLKITVGSFHSSYKNKQIALMLFELALDEIIK